MNRKKRIAILGEEVNVRFNMAVQLAYEEMLDEPFDLSSLTHRKQQVALYLAVIIANNPDTAITYDRFTHEATACEVNALDAAIGEAMATWFNIPKVLADKIMEESTSQQEELPKN